MVNIRRSKALTSNLIPREPFFTGYADYARAILCPPPMSIYKPKLGRDSSTALVLSSNLRS